MELINATERLRQFNKSTKSNRKIQDFLQNKSSKNAILMIQAKYPRQPIIKTRRGKSDGGTWMQEELFGYFERWLLKLPNNSFAKSELEFCNAIERVFNRMLTFERQKEFGKYKVDLFCNEMNLCIEYDEHHHSGKSNTQRDMFRQQEIEQQYGVKFLRHKEGDTIYDTLNHLVEEASMRLFFVGGLPEIFTKSLYHSK